MLEQRASAEDLTVCWKQLKRARPTVVRDLKAWTKRGDARRH